MNSPASLLFLIWIGTFFPISDTCTQVRELNWPLETLSEGHGFTEGASLGPDASIYFSDMDHQQILRFDPKTGNTSIWQGKSGKTNGLFILGDQLYGCEAGGRAVVSYDLTRGPGSRRVLASNYRGDRLGCPNDITVVRKHLFFSEFWIPSFHRESGEKQEIFKNRVYSLDLKSGEVDTLKFNFLTPNGVASSPDGKFLFVGDIQANKLFRARLKRGLPGTLEMVVDLADLDLLGPDGMAIHKDGRIFLALYRSDKLLVLNPDGTPIGTLATGPLTTNCIFAPDGQTLYITAERKLKRVIVP